MSGNLYYTGNKDRDPAGTRRRVLEVLAAAQFPMKRRAIQGQVFGDLYGAHQTHDALLWLCDHEFVTPGYDAMSGQFHGTYRITEQGLAELHAAGVVQGEGA